MIVVRLYMRWVPRREILPFKYVTPQISVITVNT